MAEDKIMLTGIQFYGHGGVAAHERELGQRYSADVEVYFDLHPAGHSDLLSDTINYGAVYDLIVQIGQSERLQLLEALAEKMAHAVLEKTPAHRVRIRLRKLSPPIPGVIESAGIQIERARASSRGGVA